MSFEETILKFSGSVKSALETDIVSYGELRQIANNMLVPQADMSAYIQDVLARLLGNGVEIGYALNVGGQYVKFVAWRGHADERVNRALRELEMSAKTDRDFAFWLCLSSNVDEFEENTSG